jgi:hypothetical protein
VPVDAHTAVQVIPEDYKRGMVLIAFTSHQIGALHRNLAPIKADERSALANARVSIGEAWRRLEENREQAAKQLDAPRS